MMNRALIILFAGVALAVGAFCAFYFGSTTHHRAMLHSETPELEWLRKEFNLSDAEFRNIAELHDGYLPQCAEMCRRIAAKNNELQALLSATNAMTPQIERTLNEAGQLRAECQKGMLEHFFAVSRAMPEAQGKRYLRWVQERTILDHNDLMGSRHAHE